MPRHSAIVRTTHWLTTLCFFALLLSGIEILISHPRFYWGETGNVYTTPLFSIPIPSSRSMVPTGYGYVLPDQNGWSRALHFQSAWIVAVIGFVYLFAGSLKRILPQARDLSWHAISSVIAGHLRLQKPPETESASYNPLQKLTYLFVVAVLFPLVIWSGLAMSPAFASVVPATVDLLGGQQSARTIHFFVSMTLLLFLLVHITMVLLTGRMRTMIMGDKP